MLMTPISVTNSSKDDRKNTSWGVNLFLLLVVIIAAITTVHCCYKKIACCC
jgi:hypothetical protein